MLGVPRLRRCLLPINRPSVANRHVAQWIGRGDKEAQRHRGNHDNLPPGRQPHGGKSNRKPHDRAFTLTKLNR
jgi:hypothetical protein